MKVLLPVWSMSADLGGPPRSSLALAKFLAVAGHKVSIVTTSTMGMEGSIESLSKSPLIEVFVVREDEYLKTSRSEVLGADIVHFQSYFDHRNPSIAAACRRHAVPYVISPRGQLDAWSMKQKRLKKFLYMRTLGKRFLDHAAALHALTNNELEAFSKLAYDGETFVIANGVDPDEWAELPPIGAFKSRVALESSDLLIGFVARMHLKKNPTLLTRAFGLVAKANPKVALVLAGDDQGESSAVKNTAVAMDVSHKVHIVGGLAGRKRQELWRDIDIFVLVSQQEGHPRSVLEAAFLGKAIVISPEANCPELTEAGGAIEVPADEERLADVLETLIKNPSKRDELGRKAREVALRDYALDTQTQRLVEIYRSLISGLPAPENADGSTSKLQQ